MGVFSKSCEYAMRAVFYIARSTHEGRKVGIKEIAENIKSPEPFLAKILQKLSKEGLVFSVKGPNGGFYLTEENLKRPIADIVISMDGQEILTGCALGLDYCSESNPCPLHNEFKSIRNNLNKMLINTSIGQFNEELIKGHLRLFKE